MQKNVFAACVFVFLAIVLLWVSIPPWDSALIKETATFQGLRTAPKGKKKAEFITASGHKISCIASYKWNNWFSRPCPIEELQTKVGQQFFVWHDKAKPYYIQLQGQATPLVTKADFNSQIWLGIGLATLMLAMAGSALKQKN